VIEAIQRFLLRAVVAPGKFCIATRRLVAILKG
jgi:hypothetical protein